MDSHGLPLVSIGLPVYNGARFVRQAVDSLLAQSHAELELLISDNASTDATEEICRALAHEDPRVRYVRQKENIGASRNWNFVAREARGQFFKWASANDYCASDFVERCVRELRADSGLALCYGRTQLVDEGGRPIEVYGGDLSAEQERPGERLATVLRTRLNNAQQGVIRTDMLRRTALDRHFPGGDIVLMAELSLYGRFRLLPEVLLFRRQSAGTFTFMLDPVALHRIYDPSATGPMVLKRARYHWDVIRSALRARLSPSDKVQAVRVAAQRAWWDAPALKGELLELVRSLSSNRRSPGPG